MGFFQGKEHKRYLLQGYHLTEELKLKELDLLFGKKAFAHSPSRLIYKDSDTSLFFVYRFGAVIFFNVEPPRRQEVIERIKKIMGGWPELLTSEDFAVEISQGAKCSVGFESAVLDELMDDRMDMLALVLAQSIALEHFEIKTEQMLKEAGEIGRALKNKGRLIRSDRSIKRFIGKCITMKQSLISSLYLMDKPDETWSDQTLYELYRDAFEMFEVSRRHKTVDYKLRMIQESLELIADLMQNRTANLLEWTIIILIAISIVLYVLDLLIKTQ